MTKLLTFNIDSFIDWDLIMKLVELWKMVPDPNGNIITEKELSDKTGISLHTQRRMLTGEIRNPGFKNVSSLLNTIGIQLTWVVNVPDEISQEFVKKVQDIFKDSDVKPILLSQKETSTSVLERDKDKECPCQNAMMDLITHVKDLLLV